METVRLQPQSYSPFIKVQSSLGKDFSEWRLFKSNDKISHLRASEYVPWTQRLLLSRQYVTVGLRQKQTLEGSV